MPHLAVIECIGSYVDRGAQRQSASGAHDPVPPSVCLLALLHREVALVRVTGLANQLTLLVIGLIAAVALVHAITNLAACIALLIPVAVTIAERHAQSDRVRSHRHYRG